MNKQLIQRIKKLQYSQTEYCFTKTDFLEFNKVQHYGQLVVYQGYGRNVSFCLDEKLPVEVIHKSPNAEFLGCKESFLQLGIDLIGMILQQTQVLEIELTHPKSKISKIYVCTENLSAIDSAFLKHSYKIDIHQFTFFPQEVSRHPFTSFSTRHIQEVHRPGFYFSWKNSEENHTQNTQPDYLVIQAPIDGILALAELFMDFGRTENQTDEINLETSLYGGMEGSRLGSIETRFWLPGSFGFPEDDLDKTFIP